MGRRKNYIFTNKEHTRKGMMSAILGVISIVSLCAAVYFTFRNGGTAKLQYGAVGLVCTLFSLAGLTLGVLSRMEKDKYYLFSYLGIGFNLIALSMESLILYAGALSS